jgi:predicted nucleotidyltransferase
MEWQKDHQFDEIRDVLESLSRSLSRTFTDHLKCLILYGSWAKGTAREDSDVDLLALFEKLDRDTRKSLETIVREASEERTVTVVPASLEDFRKERNPLYTAVKKEGIILLGDTDFTINPAPPAVKYSDFFRKSKEFEEGKVRIAEEILKEHPDHDVTDFCYVASKHAIQAALAMKGAGYSSKVGVLSSLTEEYLGKEIADVFKRLWELYRRSEYGMEHLQQEENALALECARRVMMVYEITKRR